MCLIKRSVLKIIFLEGGFTMGIRKHFGEIGMPILIFGKHKSPDISFKQDPEKGLIISCKNNYVINYEGLKKISWHNIVYRSNPPLVQKKFVFYSEEDSKKYRKEQFPNLINSLLPLMQTKAETMFLEKYAKYVKDADHNEVLESVALIPQLWVNWIHYSAPDEERARKIRMEPFRVDFGIYSEGRKIVIEIDGTSHFSEMAAIDNKGVIQLEASLEKYTEHLRKDRWLRKQGWEVFRFTDKEVNEEDFEYFLEEMSFYDLPGYIPF